MEAHNSDSLASPVRACDGGMLSWGESGDERSCDQRQNPSSSSSSSRSSCTHLCLQSEANKCAPPFLQRTAEHPPFLKIGCAERGLKIDPPLITVSLKYLSATATFKHHSLSLGFYNPVPHPCSRHGDSHNQPYMFWIHFTLVLCTLTYSVHIPLPVLRGWKKLGFFLLFCP